MTFPDKDKVVTENNNPNFQEIFDKSSSDAKDTSNPSKAQAAWQTKTFQNKSLQYRRRYAKSH
jgi:hypothetical protein